MVGILMGLDEHAGDADRDRRPRQNGDEFALAARGLSPCPPGCWTEWVASKMTGAPVSRARIGSARMSETSVL